MKKIYKLLYIIPIFLMLTACFLNNINYDYISEKTFSDSPSGDLTINGSTSMTKLVNSLGEAFSKLYPDVIVEKSDTGSSAAVNSVINGTSIIGDISRELNSDETPEKFHEITIAFDGIALIVNNNNPINSLSSEQIHDIFSRNLSRWSQLGGNDLPITLIGREEASGTREAFENVFNRTNAQYIYTAEYPEAGDILSKVASDETAIGYISISSISDSIKPLNIDGVKPSTENIVNNTYILKRPFKEIYLKNNENPLIKNWFEFIASDEGKNIVKDMKLIPATIDII